MDAFQNLVARKDSINDGSADDLHTKSIAKDQTVILLIEVGGFVNDLVNLVLFFIRKGWSLALFTAFDYAFMVTSIFSCLIGLFAIWIRGLSIKELYKGKEQNFKLFQRLKREKRKSSRKVSIAHSSFANDAVSVSPEVKIEHTVQRIMSYKITIGLGILQDLPLVILLLYHFYFLPYTNTNCSIEPRNKTEVLQVTICAACLSYKLGYWRELRREKRKLLRYRKNLFNLSASHESELDSFASVSEQEIQQVLFIRKLVSLSSADKYDNLRILSDIKILRAIRGFDGDEIKTLGYIRDWLQWRNQHLCDKAREDILRNDYAFIDLPSLLSSIFKAKVTGQSYDLKSGKLIVQLYGGNLVDMKICENISDEELQRRFIFDGEYLDLLLDYLSIKHKKVVTLVLVHYSTRSETETAFNRLLGSLEVLKKGTIYPSFLNVEVYISSEGVKEHYEWISYICSSVQYYRISTMAAYKKACETLNELYFPKEFLPPLRSTAILIKQRPMNSFRAFRKSLRNTILPDCTFASMPIDPFGSIDVKLKDACLSKLTIEFLEISFFKDVTLREVSVVKSFKTMLENNLESGILGSQYDHVVGNVALLRILRYVSYDLKSAFAQLSHQLALRKKYKIDEMVSNILSSNMSIHEIPGWNVIVPLVPQLGNLIRDKNGNILRLFATVKNINLAMLKQRKTELREPPASLFYIYINEYFSLMADRLSKSEKRVVSLIRVTDLCRCSVKDIMKILYSLNAQMDTQIVEDSSCLSKHLFQSKHVMIGPPPSLSATLNNFSKIAPTLHRSVVGGNIELYPISTNSQEKLRMKYGFNSMKLLSLHTQQQVNMNYPTFEALLQRLEEQRCGDDAQIDISDFKDVTPEEVSFVIEFKNRIVYVIGQEEFEAHPRSFTGNVNLLRFLRYHSFDLDESLRVFLKVREIRTKYSLNMLNQEIVSNNMRMNDMKNWKILKKVVPTVGMIWYSKKDKTLYSIAGSIKYFLEVLDDIRKLNKSQTNITYIGREYFSILIDMISRQEKQVVSIKRISDVCNVSVFQCLKMWKDARKPLKLLNFEEAQLAYEVHYNESIVCGLGVSNILKFFNMVQRNYPRLYRAWLGPLVKFYTDSEADENQFESLYGVRPSRISSNTREELLLAEFPPLTELVEMLRKGEVTF